MNTLIYFIFFEYSTVVLDDEIEPSPNLQLTSKSTRAKWILDNKGVHLSQNMGVFNVKDETTSVFLVHLFPAAACTCLEQQDCVHIIAAQLSVGMKVCFLIYFSLLFEFELLQVVAILYKGG